MGELSPFFKGTTGTGLSSGRRARRTRATGGRGSARAAGRCMGPTGTGAGTERERERGVRLGRGCLPMLRHCFFNFKKDLAVVGYPRRVCVLHLLAAWAMAFACARHAVLSVCVCMGVFFVGMYLKVGLHGRLVRQQARRRGVLFARGRRDLRGPVGRRQNERRRRRLYVPQRRPVTNARR